jgi:hypothetical protein
LGHATTLLLSFHFHLAIRYSPVANRYRFTNRYSPVAVVFGSAGASPSHFSRPSSRVPRPVLSQCLPKRSLLKQAEKLEGASPDAPKIFGSAGALPSRKPLAIRYSLPFWLGRSLALPICPLSDFLSTLGTT